MSFEQPSFEFRGNTNRSSYVRGLNLRKTNYLVSVDAKPETQNSKLPDLETQNSKLETKLALL